MYRSAIYDEPLLIELGDKGKDKPIDVLPLSLQRKERVNIPDLDETQIIRHFLRLSQMNYGIESGMYPLGSCTMKYNPKICEEISRWDSFAMTHPYQDESTIQGNLQILYELEQMFCEITGMHSFTLQPAAGAQGEFTGLLLTKTYHDFNKDFDRNEIILPDTSHGTNPASATMAGYKITEIPSTKEGTVDLEILEKTLSDKTACFMLTNPNTLGIFESDILEISKMVHDAGALLYYDGANINAIMGKARPGDMGFDIVHLNLHKTFSTPHGGGGPGAGPIGVKKKLERFLPIPRIVKKNDKYHFNYEYHESIGKIKAFYGNVKVEHEYYSYKVIDTLTQEIRSRFPLEDIPIIEFESQSLWFLIPYEFQKELEMEGYDLGGTVHAVEHGMIAMAPALAQISRWDIGGLSIDFDPVKQQPIIYIYDAYRGGIGIAESLYNSLTDLLVLTHMLIDSCSCDAPNGCPACIMSPKCGNNNEPLDKNGALFLLKKLLDIHK